jgi:hypothetical protein
MEPEIAVVSAEKLMLVKTVLLKIELQKEKNSKTNTMGGEIRAPQKKNKNKKRRGKKERTCCQKLQ